MSGLCCSLMEPLVLFWRSLLLLDGQTSKYFLSKLSFTVLQVSLSHEYGCDMKPSSASSSLDIRLCADLDFNSCVTIFFFSIPQFFFSAAWSRRRTFSFFLSKVACLCLCKASLFLDFLLAASFFDVKYLFTAASKTSFATSGATPFTLFLI